ncbi:MAG: hypothetical protein M1820_008618 [Bogoriella megaspora]|nr:MAG: hypothetical protein M1820_008618 [Bogoriella megaspora]
MPSSLIARKLDFSKPNLDGLGVFFICFVTFYTLVIAAGLVGLIVKRNSVAVRIRGLKLTIASIFSLHIYTAVILCVYPENGVFKCGGEFWVMGIFFPLGLALFQAANMRLHAYSTRQRFLMHGNPGSIMNMQLTYLGIGLTFIVQLFVTLFVFFSSRKFHGSYGIFSKHVGPLDCRRGYEWIPTIFFQFFWTYVCGPYILFRTRHVHDLHYWGLQTRLTILAGLPGTPMWLAFLYGNSSAIKSVDTYWFPGLWFLPGLVTIQLSSIILPLWDAYRESKLLRRYNALNQSPHATNNSVSPSEKESAERNMAALDLMLERNIDPLLSWAARREFTAENIVFLKAVRDFKRKWRSVADKRTYDDMTRTELFEDAAYIYFSIVDQNTAAFNINIEYRIYEQLRILFSNVKVSDRALDSPTTERSDVCPFDDLQPFAHDVEGSKTAALVDLNRAYALPTTEIESVIPGRAVEVPRDFDIHVFDDAYKSVKYLVFTNTWQRYINASETSSLQSTDTELESAPSLSIMKSKSST